MTIQETSPRLPSIGWLGLGRDDNLDTFTGWQANVFAYMKTPHQTLILRLDSPGEKENEWYIVSPSCNTLPIRPYWTIGRLECTRVSHNGFILEDVPNGIRVESGAPRLFDLAGYKTWLGNDDWLANPSEDKARAVLRQNAEF